MKKLNTGKFVSVIDPNDLQVCDFIGQGAAGSVHRAIYKPNGMTLALKVII